ncbi:MAG: hypothetical protein KKA73_25805 [Chloroflexi bacterium]|nr:hypothetical protein [Chloroflexota bacterium]MBU1751114.1 hypothetical protein [Chloroflexota bacterium]MBU1879460.1 hypothetical protein [Chloroflexota bacterium]
MSSPTPRDASFIVRIWWEGRSPEPGALVWRGQVQHATSGESIGFCNMVELYEFLQRWTGAYNSTDQTAEVCLEKPRRS